MHTKLDCRRHGMSESTVRRLAGAEWDFARLDAALVDLAQELHKSAQEAPNCGPAVLTLKKIRRDLMKVFRSLNEDISDAIVAAEALPGAPF